MTAGESAKRFYAWWLATLSGLLTRRKPAAQSWDTLLVKTPSDLDIYVRAGSSVKAVGALPADAGDEHAAVLKSTLKTSLKSSSKDVLLRLSPGDVLTTGLQIPNAASDLITPILENQMERLIPWPASETLYGYRVIGSNPDAPSQIDVEIVATRKDILEQALGRARALGLEPFAADYAASPEADSSVELVSFRPDPAQRVASVLHTLMLCTLTLAVLVGGVGGYRLWEKHAALTELREKASTARQRVAALGKLEAENEQLRAQRDRLVRRKEEDPPIILLLEALSQGLPDTSFATEIEFEKRDVRVVGKSANATALIADLEDSPHFQDVRFAAPTTREADDTLESFVIIGRTEGGANLQGVP